MKSLFKILKNKDVAEIGIGAMIVFIAMVLVAGIAASVLIQTATRLESQAMKTGQDTIAEVASGIAVYDVTGKVNASDLGLLAITVRARAGAAAGGSVRTRPHPGPQLRRGVQPGSGAVLFI